MKINSCSKDVLSFYIKILSYSDVKILDHYFKNKICGDNWWDIDGGIPAAGYLANHFDQYAFAYLKSSFTVLYWQAVKKREDAIEELSRACLSNPNAMKWVIKLILDVPVNDILLRVIIDNMASNFDLRILNAVLQDLSNEIEYKENEKLAKILSISCVEIKQIAVNKRKEPPLRMQDDEADNLMISNLTQGIFYSHHSGSKDTSSHLINDDERKVEKTTTTSQSRASKYPRLATEGAAAPSNVSAMTMLGSPIFSSPSSLSSSSPMSQSTALKETKR